MEHSILAPSSMARLIQCPGSFALTKFYPEPDDSPASMEGTAAHWVCAELIAKRHVTVGQLAPNGIAVTDEMIEGAEMYFDTIPSRMLLPCMPFHVERRVTLPRIHSECWGTPDLDYYMDGVAYISDYKFGHEFVDVYENWQMLAYATGVLDDFGMYDGSTDVEFTIVQPRCYHRDGTVRKWTVKANELLKYVARMHDVAHEVMTNPMSAKCVPGAQCSHCPAAHACEALQQANQAVFDFTSTPVPMEMSPAAKGLYLRRVQQAMILLKAIETGMIDDCTAAIRRGVAIPGYTLEAGMGRTKWSHSIEEVAALGDMLGANFRKNDLITPKQAQKALKDLGIDGSVIKQYSAAMSGEVSLVKSNESMTSRVFGKQ